jgi:hypothetical protein
MRNTALDNKKKSDELKKDLTWKNFKHEDKKLIIGFIVIPVVFITLLLGLALLNL